MTPAPINLGELERRLSEIEAEHLRLASWNKGKDRPARCAFHHDAALTIRDAKARLRAAEGAWQPIETARKDGTAVLIFSPTYGAGIGCRKAVSFDGLAFDEDTGAFVQNRQGGASICMPSDAWRDATHWRPLPPPPETTTSSGEG